ncbi:protein disulfide isomerase [Trichuris suis]|nr:protein disulfide isomerase [Trichuris suis]
MSFFFRKPVKMFTNCWELRRSLSADDLWALLCNGRGKATEVHSNCETGGNQKATCAGVQSEIGLQSSLNEDKLEICDFTALPFSTAGAFTDSSAGQLEGDLTETKEKVKRPRKPIKKQPNYFIAFRIKNQTILERLEAVQDCVTKKVKLPKSALVSLKKAHITLAVLRLDEVHCLHDARSALHKAAKEMAERDLSISLEFQGLGSFSGHVLFARVAKNDSFAKLLWIRECLVKSFRDVGISLTDDNFSPHLTVAKLTYVSKKEAKKRLKIKLEDFNDMSETHFGTEIVESVDVCGLCETVREEFVKAAAALKKEGSEIRLAEVNVSSEDSLAQKHIRRIIPTLKFYKKSKEIYYKGGRTADEIIQWVKQKVAPAAVELKTLLSADNFITENDPAVVGFFKDLDSPEAKAFRDVADTFDELKFGIVSRKEIYNALKVEKDSVIIFKATDDNEVYDGDYSEESLKAWIPEHSLPLVPYYKDSISGLLYAENKKKNHLYLFISRDDEEYDELKSVMERTARMFKGEPLTRGEGLDLIAIFIFLSIAMLSGSVMFVIMDAKSRSVRHILEYFHLDRSDLPEIRLVNLTMEPFKKYRPEFELVTVDKLKNFVQSYLNGILKPYYFSQRLPDDWETKPIKVLSTEVFDHFIGNSSTDVLVLFHKDDCDLCDQFHGILKKLAPVYNESNSVTFATFDESLNEMTSAGETLAPMLVLFVGEEHKGYVYEGEPKLELVQMFIDSRGQKGGVRMDQVADSITEKDTRGDGAHSEL